MYCERDDTADGLDTFYLVPNLYLLGSKKIKTKTIKE